LSLVGRNRCLKPDQQETIAMRTIETKLYKFDELIDKFNLMIFVNELESNQGLDETPYDELMCYSYDELLNMLYEL
jgi:hypothetical protein